MKRCASKSFPSSKVGRVATHATLVKPSDLVQDTVEITFQSSPVLSRILRHILRDDIWMRYGPKGLAGVESWISVDD